MFLKKWTASLTVKKILTGSGNPARTRQSTTMEWPKKAIIDKATTVVKAVLSQRGPPVIKKTDCGYLFRGFTEIRPQSEADFEESTLFSDRNLMFETW